MPQTECSGTTSPCQMPRDLDCTIVQSLGSRRRARSRTTKFDQDLDQLVRPMSRETVQSSPLSRPRRCLDRASVQLTRGTTMNTALQIKWFASHALTFTLLTLPLACSAGS